MVVRGEGRPGVGPLLLSGVEPTGEPTGFQPVEPQLLVFAPA
jgi:hypothetical protein